MSMLLEKNGELGVLDCYDERDKVKLLGARWDKESRMWLMPLTISNVESCMSRLSNVLIESNLEEVLEIQRLKEEKLERISYLSKQNAEIRFKVPGISASLFNYQKFGVMFAVTNDDGFLLADDMGLGKTIQSLAMSCYRKYKYNIDSCLLIVPASVKWNWPLEIEKFTDQEYVVIGGDPEGRVKQWKGHTACHRISDGNGGYNYEYYDMMDGKKPFYYITNYELLTEDLFGGKNITIKEDDDNKTIVRKEKMIKKAQTRAAQLLDIRKKLWDCIIVDEAHMLKNHNSNRSKQVKSLRGGFRVALTGTPMDGRLEELHSVMEFVKPGLFTSKHSFLQRHADFDFWGKITKYKRIDEVREKIKPFFLRRLKKDVLKDLPDKIYQNRYIELSPAERKIYDKLADKSHPVTEDTEAMVKVIRCKQFCDHPEILDETCKGSKMQLFMEIMEELVKYNGEKVVIFSQYATMINIVDRELKAKGYNFLKITGGDSTKGLTRADMQDKFNNDPNIDAMIGTEAMSTGLNFQGASYVINLDDNWSPALMRQRSGRCHRMGQKNTVTVINFICKDTIEERIRETLYNKDVISSETLGDQTDEMVLKRLGPQDILKLL